MTKKFEVRRSKSDIRTLKVGDRRFKTNKKGDGGLRASDFGLRTLIVGYGNPLRSDDAIGWHASRLLAAALAGEEVEVITCHQLTPELAEPLSQCRRAVFIDADAEGKPGEIQRRAVRPQAPASTSFTHTSTPSGLLRSAQELYGRRPKAIIITVSAQSFEFGDTLSPVVAAALPKVVDEVRNWVASAHELKPAND
jgi:hydrogenase maturation protease